MTKINFLAGRIEIIGAVLSALIAAGGMYWWMLSYAGERVAVPAVAAAKDLPAPRQITAGDLTSLNLPKSALPKKFFSTPGELIGKVLRREKSANEIITLADLSLSTNANSPAAEIPPGRVGLVLPSNWLLAPLPKAAKDDFVSVYAVSPAKIVSEAGLLIKNALILAVSSEREQNPNSLLVSLSADEVNKLMRARAGQYGLAVVVEPANINTSTAF